MPNCLRFFQQLFAESDVRLQKVISGSEMPKPRSAVYEALDNKIIKLLNEYDVSKICFS